MESEKPKGATWLEITATLVLIVFVVLWFLNLI